MRDEIDSNTNANDSNRNYTCHFTGTKWKIKTNTMKDRKMWITINMVWSNFHCINSSKGLFVSGLYCVSVCLICSASAFSSAKNVHNIRMRREEGGSMTWENSLNVVYLKHGVCLFIRLFSGKCYNYTSNSFRTIVFLFHLAMIRSIPTM